MLRQTERGPANEGTWLLLAELNHRVRNELQVALSALHLAKRDFAFAGPAPFIEEAVARLEGLGDVHQLLDRQARQEPLAQRLEALCRATSLSNATPRGIRIEVEADDVSADEETAWTVCVVAAELMTNALKHAFPGGTRGLVSVVLRQEGGDLVLRVTDSGVGASATAGSARAIWQAPGFGSGIVTRLAERLGGSVTTVGGPDGTTATFRAPALRGAPRWPPG